MPKPVPDSSTGWWSIRIKSSDGNRRKVMLAKDPRWVKGKPLPKKPTPDIELIARKYQDMHVQALHGVDVAPSRATNLAEFLAEYQSYYATGHRPNSVRVVGQCVGHFLAWCGKHAVKNVQAVGVAECEKYLNGRRKAGASRTTVSLEKSCLAPAWSRAVRTGSLKENPWKFAVIPGKARATEAGYWTAEEVEKLVGAAEGWVRDLILVALNCGGRMSSVLALKWEDVVWGRGVVKLDGKTGPYQVPMSSTLRDVLERIDYTSRTDLVFPDDTGKKPRSTGSTYHAIRRTAKKAGLPAKGHYNHILRHTFASHALIRGVPLAIVSRWLGHASINQTMRYAHLGQSESTRLMEGFSLGSDPLQKTKADPEP